MGNENENGEQWQRLLGQYVWSVCYTGSSMVDHPTTMVGGYFSNEAWEISSSWFNVFVIYSPLEARIHALVRIPKFDLYGNYETSVAQR